MLNIPLEMGLPKALAKSHWQKTSFLAKNTSPFLLKTPPDRSLVISYGAAKRALTRTMSITLNF